MPQAAGEQRASRLAISRNSARTASAPVSAPLRTPDRYARRGALTRVDQRPAAGVGAALALALAGAAVLALARARAAVLRRRSLNADLGIQVVEASIEVLRSQSCRPPVAGTASRGRRWCGTRPASGLAAGQGAGLHALVDPGIESAARRSAARAGRRREGRSRERSGGDDRKDALRVLLLKCYGVGRCAINPGEPRKFRGQFSVFGICSSPEFIIPARSRCNLKHKGRATALPFGTCGRG